MRRPTLGGVQISFPTGFNAESQSDDLGWNDMGHPDDFAQEQVYPPPVAVPPVLRQREALHEEFETPSALVPKAYEPEAYEPEAVAETDFFEPEPALEPEPAFEPAPESPEPVARVVAPKPVVRAAALAPVPVSLATAARIGRETEAKRSKAAFTLRLDHDRHLRLRLASALHNCSAQVLVTQALDSFLQSLPEVEELASQLPSRAKR